MGVLAIARAPAELGFHCMKAFPLPALLAVFCLWTESVAILSASAASVQAARSSLSMGERVGAPEMSGLPPGPLRILAIGIGAYRHVPPLLFAAADARDLA